MTWLYIMVIAGILACSIAQLWLKRAATSNASSLLQWRVILPYAVFAASLVINVAALGRGMSLKQMPVLEALGYVFVPTLAYIILHEKINRYDLMAVTLIITGIIVFHM